VDNSDEEESSPKTSSSDVYTNKNSKFSSASSMTEEAKNIDEQVGIDDIAKIEEQLKKQSYTEVSKES